MSTRPPSTNFSSSWTRVDQTSDPSFYANVLEATRAQGLERARREPDTVFGPLRLRPGLRVLDVGCGTGEYLRLLAPFVAPGAAVGVDLSETLIGHARNRALAEHTNVAFKLGDAYALPFPDRSFDRVTANQVLLHLTDPWKAVAEMRRVLTPTGRLLIAEWDWDSLCLALSDRDLGRRFTHLLCDQMYNGLIVRDLAWRLASSGFAQVAMTPEIRVTRELDATYEWLIEPATREFVRTGALTVDEGEELLDDLRHRAGTGRYFLARTYYSTVAIVS